MSTNLGVGKSGNTFRLVPGHFGVPANTKINPNYNQRINSQPKIEEEIIPPKEPVREEPEVIPIQPVNLEQQTRNQWTNAFNQIAQTQLYNGFTKIKRLLLSSPDHRKTRLCYIDFKSMQCLIDQARKNKSKTGVMSLKTLLRSSNQDITEPVNLEEHITTVQLLEQLGPPDHALIALNEDQIAFVRSRVANEVYWPSGTEGITCLTTYDNTSNSQNWSN